MPAIAAGAARDRAQFYWHLGDYRAIYAFDEDIVHQPEHLKKPLTIGDYESLAWQDFIESQLASFGSMPVFLAMGNHEAIPPMNRDELLPRFADWLNTPVIARQRLQDDPHDHRMKTYYHWIEHGVAFYTLDNATTDQFDPDQLSWFERVLARDSADRSVATVVVGMHEALPDSIAAVHSMSDFAAGTESGRRVYADLLRAQNEAHKRVYVLASHSHYFMDGIFNSQYWRAHGGVLPGWIVGTAGAVRYPLPANIKDARAAQTNVYGYLLATVAAFGRDSLRFREIGGERFASRRWQALPGRLHSLVLRAKQPGAVIAVGVQRVARLLGAQEVGPPVLHALLDDFAIRQLLVEHLAGQHRQFIVAGKSQSNQLVQRELPDARTQFGGQQPLEPHLHFETNDAILHGKGHDAQQDDGHRQRQGHDCAPDRRKRDAVLQAHQRVDQVDQKYGQHEEVKRRHQASVVLEVLRLHCFHDDTPLA